MNAALVHRPGHVAAPAPAANTEEDIWKKLANYVPDEMIRPAARDALGNARKRRRSSSPAEDRRPAKRQRAEALDLIEKIRARIGHHDQEAQDFEGRLESVLLCLGGGEPAVVDEALPLLERMAARIQHRIQTAELLESFLDSIALCEDRAREPSPSQPPSPPPLAPPPPPPLNTELTIRSVGSTIVRRVHLTSRADAPSLPRPNLRLRVRMGGQQRLSREVYLRSRDPDAARVPEAEEHEVKIKREQTEEDGVEIKMEPVDEDEVWMRKEPTEDEVWIRKEPTEDDIKFWEQG
ncbi:hypothetical protein N658DRAFT_488839 [Parathielavia hyrcaniae]|uniref:Uncharacterized protein n=1 Tax=Parathielavia hyrcaniae TaxID=113614 RepID=A0AAN6PXM3_9PEZI|nr:hypothetical protein N658DRAFT_488839 [Parathielavia hyrcaniae]